MAVAADEGVVAEFPEQQVAVAAADEGVVAGPAVLVADQVRVVLDAVVAQGMIVSPKTKSVASPKRNLKVSVPDSPRAISPTDRSLPVSR